ncbi:MULTISPECIES: MFS transporter [Paenibacillus]|uniref:MFS transporter n=2 Tax=Paenibacillus naphthalenovorans TaxID=162209 RepID=A0A0U2UNM0_9BACL|nr:MULTISPECIES: MFS transporter [Paenibacillus]ALS23585.1 MFS transporter [Paenibacillus naphthalenovorans]GCL73424.1 MFS transporter [Paenibacillus naphthalenovorans]SDJ30203.1 Major Facilitator Superfamily protein [Paenibacillus naphthalenovorans]
MENNPLSRNRGHAIRSLMLSQSAALFGSGLVFPFYLIFIKEIGAGFTEYGLAYGLFTISSSLLQPRLGAWSDRYGRKSLLLWSAWGMAVLFLFFPVVTGIWQVYVLQVLMGLFGAMQKTGEKALLADVTEGPVRGRQIGSYHGWIGLFSGLAVIAGGVLIDFFTLDLIFYIGSLWMFVSGFLLLRMEEKR